MVDAFGIRSFVRIHLIVGWSLLAGWCREKGMQKIAFSRLWPILALAAILALGAYLRISILQERDFWFDEAFTAAAVQQSWPAMMRTIINDVHPPLYYWLLKLWTYAAGDSPTAIRTFSTFFGIATIALAFFALRLWQARQLWPALAAALVVAINPFLINYSQEARMYSLLAFLI